MPFHLRSLSAFAVALLLGFGVEGAGAQPRLVPPKAKSETRPLHWSGDRTQWDRKTGKVILDGNASVNQPGETLRADHIEIQLDTRELDARGNCVYVASESVIYGEEMHFNLDTRTGTIIGGKVANDRFSLTGERLNKMGEGRFQTHRGTYTTCLDCPQSWTLQGEDVDMELEGYAYLNGVTARVKDIPVVWMPYLVVPLKTQRQTGFLFPRFGFTDVGFNFVLPFFWATSQSTDMTIGVGHYGGRGLRTEWEGRYVLSTRSGGTARAYLLRDSTFETLLASRGLESTSTRYAVDLTQTQELPFGIDQKFKITEMSDNLYPTRVGDVRGAGEATVPSELFFSRSGEQVSAYIAARRYRNLILLDKDPRVFDPTTVQVFPTAEITSNDRILFGSPAIAGVTFGVSNFTRNTSSFDVDLLTPGGSTTSPRLGIDPIRRATRMAVTPTLYTTVRPFGLFSIVPSAQYRSYFYSFHNEIPNLQRGYLLAQVDFLAQLEKIYDTSNPEAPRVKHLVRPMLTYSRIPFVDEDSSHPFVRQIKYAQDNDFTGYQFDNLDIVPVDTNRNYNNYFTPLGNSLTIGMTTQLIRRRGKITAKDASYQRFIELKTGETINFQELDKPEADRQPFSRYFLSGSFDFSPLAGSFDYFYLPYGDISPTQSRHVISTTFSYLIERSTHQRILAFERSFNLGYSFNKSGGGQTNNLRFGGVYSINDYLTPALSTSYDLIEHQWLRADGEFRLQHWSQCYRFSVNASLYKCQKERPEDSGVCNSVGFDFTLNLTGSGFGGFGEVAGQVMR